MALFNQKYGLPMLKKAGLFRSVNPQGPVSSYQDNSESDTQDQSEMSSDKPDYSYGVEKPGMPDMPKHKWWQTLLNIALPAITGVSEGHGLIPSAGVGFMMDQEQRQNEKNAALNLYKNRMKDYEDERKFRQADELGRIDRGLRKAQLAETTRVHNDLVPNLSEENAFKSLSPEEAADIVKRAPQELERLMTHPDPQIQKAASFLYKTRSKSKQLLAPGKIDLNALMNDDTDSQ